MYKCTRRSGGAEIASAIFFAGRYAMEKPQTKDVEKKKTVNFFPYHENENN